MAGPTAAGPRYAAVAQSLKDEIIGGVHPVGALLPTEGELSARFAVSRHTVRAALRILREERLVASRQGAGTMVVPPAPSEAFRLEANSINDLVAYAADMYTEIRSTQMVTVDGRAAARLGVTGGREWLLVQGMARFKRRQMPVCWSEYYINRDYAGVARLLSRNAGPIFLLIEDMFGVSIAEMDQSISTGSLSATIAEELRGQQGDTSIEVRRSYRSGDGTLVQLSLHTHPAARFQQTIRMRRLRD